MNVELVISNLRQRFVRTVISIVGVAIGIVLVIMIAGLANGMLGEQGRRNANVSAELLFSRGGAYGPGSSAALSLPVEYASRLAAVNGVRAVSPIAQYVKPSSQSFGMELVEGIEPISYQQVTNLAVKQGRMFNPTAYEVIIDPVYAKDKKVRIGDKIDMFNRKFEITGIYEPEIGSRLKVSLTVMQQLLGSPERCSFIYVRCQDNSLPETTAQQILAAYPGNKLIFTRDIQAIYEKGIPSLNVFIKVITGVGMTISTLVIMLAMYTTITERTREIGILKSLGASKRFIIAAIEQEALVISVCGVILGLLVALLAKVLIMRFTTLLIDFQWQWVCYTAISGVTSGLLGAFYPAVKAARQDAVKSLSYE
jgi:putative ABC transport system permease protein